MIPETVLRWGGGGSVIRELSAYGARRAREVGEENVFDFAIGSPSADPPAALHDAMRRLMETVPPAELHTYVPAPGLPSVRAKVADFLNAQFFMDYRPEDICLTDGASSALALVTRALLSPGEEVVIPTPAFPEYWVYVESVGGVVKPVPCLPESFLNEGIFFYQIMFQRFRIVCGNRSDKVLPPMLLHSAPRECLPDYA